jgi:hypothetical protein
MNILRLALDEQALKEKMRREMWMPVTLIKHFATLSIVPEGHSDTAKPVPEPDSN